VRKPSPNTYAPSGSYGPEIKKADRYWFAPPGAKKPLIPIAKIGYVRSSEIIEFIGAG
jgi:hypothetical protein